MKTIVDKYLHSNSEDLATLQEALKGMQLSGTSDYITFLKKRLLSTLSLHM